MGTRTFGKNAFTMLLALVALTASGTATLADASCPAGARLMGASPPDGLEQGCELIDKDGSRTRHGHWVFWYLNGQKQKEGDYFNDERQGTWTWWYPTGQKMQEGYFQNGRQVGTWLYWDEKGRQTDEPGGAVVKAGEAGPPSSKEKDSPKRPTLQMDQFSNQLQKSFQ